MSKKIITDKEELKQFDHPMFGKASKAEVLDIGEEVICDICNADYTESDEEGGFLFGSATTYCPKCAVDGLPRIKSYGEEEYITAYCPEGMTFKEFVLKLRGGDNTVKFVEYEK